jgi:glycosyltransferase involved in cell wall biosynthesis
VLAEDGELRVNVLRLITRLNIGGPARQALTLTKEIGPEFPTVLAAGRPSAAEAELVDPDVPVRPVPLVRPIDPRRDGRALVAVRRLMSETGAGLLHTHMAKAGAIGRWAATTVRSRPLTVHTYHGHVLEGYFRVPSQRAFIEIERNLARRTDALVAVSAEVRDALLDLDIGTASQFRVIPLGLDLAPFLAASNGNGSLRRSLGLRSDVPLVGAVGRLVPIKDLTTLLSAIARLPGVHLAVIGDGELRSALEERARKWAIGDRVHFTGWWSDVAGALEDLDVVALTSLSEGTPVALIEAAASGRPVVATRVGGVPLVVEDGVTGLLARPGDVEGIAALIRRLLNDPAARRTMGEAGRLRVQERFAKDRLLRDIRELYADLLSARRTA